MTRQPWTTDADRAELAVAVVELVHGLDAHRQSCPTCRALADPCPVREGIRREEKRFDLHPLDAPSGFYAEIRRRLDDHDASCRTCLLASPGYCRTVGNAIEVLLEWRWRRGLHSRAEWHRRRHIRERLAELHGDAA